jgi:hypothetical protein
LTSSRKNFGLRPGRCGTSASAALGARSCRIECVARGLDRADEAGRASRVDAAPPQQWPDTASAVPVELETRPYIGRH